MKVLDIRKDGLEDIGKQGIAEITPESYAALRAGGVINKGMLPKIDGAFRAIDGGVSCVVIKRADELLSESGTTIRK